MACVLLQVCVRARPLKRREKTVWEFDARDHTIKLKQGATVRRAAAFYADSEHKLPVFKYNSVFEVRRTAGPICMPSESPTPLWKLLRRAGCPQEDDSTRDVYESTVQGLVKGAMEGFNGTVFAYGQTGSGKTHTIVGKKSEPGILIMAAEEVLASVSKVQQSASHQLRIHFPSISLRRVLERLVLMLCRGLPPSRSHRQRQRDAART